MEAQAVELRLSRQKSLKLVNIYIPPARGQAEYDIREDLAQLPRGEDVVWAGDFNAHHPIWDLAMRMDSRGDWLSEKWTDDV